MKKNNHGKTAISAIIMLGLAILLSNPGLLPLSESTKETMLKLKTENFLMNGSFKITLAHILTCILAVCIVWLVYTICKYLLLALGKKDDHSLAVSSLLAGVLKYVAAVIAVVWCLSIFGVNATAVLAGIGILGLILGFGAQSLIEDIITGIFIIFESQYQIGDIIILDDFRGTVRDIGVRTTVIEDVGGNLKVVNNSDIRNFQNRSRNISVALAEVSVSYSTNIIELEEILKENLPLMYEKHSDIYLEVPRLLGVNSLADSGVILKFAVNVKEENVFTAQRQMLRDLKILFDETGIEIPFPQVVVHKG